MVRTARNIKKEKGILGIPDSIHRHGLSDELLARVKSFYEEDQISWMCAGKKDCLTIKNSDCTKERHQKRLILCNIREAYLQYKSTFPDDKIGFSKFAELRPKWFRTVGQSGSYNICVCGYHQNVKLMLSAVNPTLRYQVLLEMCVCDVTRKDCMLNKCEDCPAFENVVDFLRNEICKKQSADDTIFFKQWEKVDCSELMDDELPIDEFLEVIVEKLKKAFIIPLYLQTTSELPEK